MFWIAAYFDAVWFDGLSCLGSVPSNKNGFLPSPFYFYNPATLPTLNSHTSKHEMTYYDYPTSTLLESHVVFLSTCMKDLKGKF